MKNNRTITDIVCPKCKSENWYEFSTDDISFEADGTGYYRFDIHCKDCGANSRVGFAFEYNITEKGGAE